jgi:hypothetical protein
MMVPGQAVALELVQLPPGELGARRASARCLFIVLDGQADLLAGGHHAIRTGDTITIPESFAYGLTAGPKGLEALVVSFPNGQGETVKEVLTLEQLLARNQERTRASLEKPFFQKLAGDARQDPADRARFRDHLRVFSDAFQTLLFARQATCSDANRAALFANHLREELGHGDPPAGPDARPVAFDPVLHATASWFCNQMFLLDDLDKIVVNLVLETARAKYFETRVADGERQKLGLHLLRDQPPQVYRRLAAVLERSWDMFEAMTGRIVELVENRTEGVTNGS